MILEELAKMMRPAGGGVHVVSTGLAAQRSLQRRLYGAARDEEIDARWREALASVREARVLVLGVPSDTGAGFVRGANQAPAALREALLAAPAHPYHDAGVVDVGDVLVVPQLLEDEMCSAAQLARTRAALHGDPASPLPVSPLSVAARCLEHLAALAPRAVPVVLGGDHSVGWPAFSVAHARAAREGHRVGLLHFDAHTDLLSERLGVRYCFATWAYHANELLGRDGRLVQVGIRASARDRAHWESTLGVRQYWPEEIAARSVKDIASEIVERFARLGVDRVYVSNDIDGTDPRFAAATGTPEPGGLDRELVRALTRAVTARLPLLGADLVEIAPPVAGELAGEPDRTLETGLAYLEDLIAAGLS